MSDQTKPRSPATRLYHRLVAAVEESIRNENLGCAEILGAVEFARMATHRMIERHCADVEKDQAARAAGQGKEQADAKKES